jgi:hypothetical protein
MTRLLLLGAVAACVCACSAAPILSPTPNTTAPPNTPRVPSAPSAGWAVAVQTVGNTGPDFCIWTAAVGTTFTGDYTVTWNGSTVLFRPLDWVDWESYTAKVDGVRFDATNPPTEFGPSNGMCAHYLYASSLSGSFAPDNNSFTATETWSFTLDSGQVKTVTFSWVGIRR